MNDAPALEAADVGIAMASGSDVAKGAADMVLLKNGLEVIVDGIEGGRRIFTNVNRYLLYTMVSNFANVFIVAVASLVVSFIPLLPGQVLILNLLTDVPMLAIVTDRVSPEDLERPRHWDVRRIMDLTLYLGVTNALFAFGLLHFLIGQPEAVIHTVWFLLLGVTALLILFSIRTPRWFWQTTAPSPPLLFASGLALLVLVGLINVPATQQLLGFAPLPWAGQIAIVLYSIVYVVVADVVKQGYLRHIAR